MADHLHTQLLAEMPSLRSFAMFMTRQRDEADDLVQDTVVRALSRAEQFEAGSNLKAWLFAIMRNQRFDTLRRRKRTPVIQVDDESLHNFAGTAANQFDNLVMKELVHAIGRLADDKREVLSLVVANGLSYEDAARVCGVPIGTVRSRLARARRNLKCALMGPDGDTAGEDDFPWLLEGASAPVS